MGDIIYRYITAEQFSPECLINCLDLSSEHQTSEVVNGIEAAVLVWRQRSGKKRTNHAKTGRSSWSGKVKGLVGDTGRSHLLAHRAETLLQSLRLRYPGLPQSVLDMNKIQYNKVITGLFYIYQLGAVVFASPSINVVILLFILLIAVEAP